MAHCRHDTTRFPFCPQPERLSASRPCAVGAAQLRHGARRAAGGCCCASRTSTAPAAARSTRRRSSRTSPGSASSGRRRCGGSPSISRTTGRRSTGCSDMRLTFPELRIARRDRAPGGRPRIARALAARSGRRAALSRHRASDERGGARGAHRRGRALRDPPRHGRGAGMGRAAALDRDRRRVPAARPARFAAEPEAWGDVILGRKDTPTSYHLSVVIDDALQGVTARGARAGPVLVHQRAPPAAIAARSARAGLSPSPADPRRRGPQAVQVDPARRACANCARRA